ncbi:low molecular mass 30 kDa lipoprotein 19G1-like [Bombyx mandarina]|uniref:Low molecular mass 30 kDa lipoprotein 19G1-like n=1 Tax=Bombyx mandarina TaxID=7092 RepID=A0A6J2KB13_BOMMA|nr:low molecular mass 30 kDa lipoprotein 19G1-like [Bombyx mandarina]
MELKEVVLLMCVLAVSANSIVNKEAADNIAAVETVNSTSIISTVDSVSTEATVTLDNVTSTQSPPMSVVSKQLENKLYNFIVARKFDEAVENTISLYGAGGCNIIERVIERLFDEGQSIVFDYSYKFSISRAAYIVSRCFPAVIRIHESLVFAKLINKRDGYALTYSNRVESDGDRRALGDHNTKTRIGIEWSLVAHWSGDRLYYKMRPLRIAMFLKLGNSTDEDGDHTAYISHDDSTNRHLWTIQPVRHNGELLFYIINREFDKLLKFGQSTEHDGYRIAYGHSTKDFNPDMFSWYIKVM